MTSLTLVRRIAARPSIVFEALTTADSIASWWGPDDAAVLAAEVDARIGGDYRVRFRTLDGQEHEACGQYLEVVCPLRIVMSWRWTYGGPPEEFGRVSRVEMDLRSIDTGTELTFTHAQLQNVASQESHRQGWTGALTKLLRLLSDAPEQQRGRSFERRGHGN